MIHVPLHGGDSVLEGMHALGAVVVEEVDVHEHDGYDAHLTKMPPRLRLEEEEEEISEWRRRGGKEK